MFGADLPPRETERLLTRELKSLAECSIMNSAADTAGLTEQVFGNTIRLLEAQRRRPKLPASTR